jgi:hypothetical protein
VDPLGFESYVSNEGSYCDAIPLLRLLPAGDAYVGVGPEQNLSYIAALRPSIAIIVDVRRQNLLQHLIFKVLIEMAPERAQFLALLFARRLVGPTPASVRDLMAAIDQAPRDPKMLHATSQAAEDRLTAILGSQFTIDDRQHVRRILNAFYDDGPDIRYFRSLRDTPGLAPTFGDLMAKRGLDGQECSFVASDSLFSVVQKLHRNDQIVPVVGDFAGPQAMRAIGSHLRSRAVRLSVFYASNVEQYLHRQGRLESFRANLRRLPWDDSSLLIRAVFGPPSGIATRPADQAAATRIEPISRAVSASRP